MVEGLMRRGVHSRLIATILAGSAPPAPLPLRLQDMPAYTSALDTSAGIKVAPQYWAACEENGWRNKITALICYNPVLRVKMLAEQAVEWGVALESAVELLALCAPSLAASMAAVHSSASKR